VPRLGFPLSHDRLDAPRSEHFGACRWLGVVEAGAPPRFLRNEGLNGRWVAEALAAAGVSDVVAGHLGGGAYRHLAGVGIRVWVGEPADATVARLVEPFAAGMLAPMPVPPPARPARSAAACCREGSG
jgi:predicted Fe-Mo cluster-binding NifX family protein